MVVVGNGYTARTGDRDMRNPQIKLSHTFSDADGNPGVIQTECAPNLVDQAWAEIIALVAVLKQKKE